MKLAICSDLHQEFGPISLENTESVDVLILAGDIIVEQQYDFHSNYQSSEKYYKFFSEISERFPNIIYVFGNHEYYHGNLQYSVNNLKDALKTFSNIHILNNESLVIDDIKFIGSTLWTSLNNSNPVTNFYVQSSMNDYRHIKNGEYKLVASDTVEENKKSFNYINDNINHEKVVVITHHAPSYQLMNDRYGSNSELEHAYYNNYDQFIIDNPQIKAWIFGHTHSKHDIIIGETRVLSNPRGYVGYDNISENFKLEYIEV